MDIVRAATRKALGSPEVRERLGGLGMEIRLMDTEEYVRFWKETENQARELLAMVK